MTSPTPPLEAEKVARSLTAAQREALLSTVRVVPGALFDSRLVEAGYELLGMRLLGAKPTPLGLEVRAILESEQP